MPKRTIPKIRKELHKITAELRLRGVDPLLCDDIDTLAEETRRAKNKPKQLPADVVAGVVGRA